MQYRLGIRNLIELMRNESSGSRSRSRKICHFMMVAHGITVVAEAGTFFIRSCYSGIGSIDCAQPGDFIELHQFNRARGRKLIPRFHH